MTNPKFQRLLLDFRLKAAEDVFSKANFNNDLFQASVEKVTEEQKIKKEISNQYDKNKVPKWDLSLNLKTKRGLVVVSSVLVFVSCIIIFIHFILYNKKDKVGGFKK
jgi:hypothetical protein